VGVAVGVAVYSWYLANFWQNFGKVLGIQSDPANSIYFNLLQTADSNAAKPVDGQNESLVNSPTVVMVCQHVCLKRE